jgi:hypothetical protein
MLHKLEYNHLSRFASKTHRIGQSTPHNGDVLRDLDVHFKVWGQTDTQFRTKYDIRRSFHILIGALYVNAIKNHMYSTFVTRVSLHRRSRCFKNRVYVKF